MIEPKLFGPDLRVEIQKVGDQPVQYQDFEYSRSWGCDNAGDTPPNERGDGGLWYNYSSDSNSNSLQFLCKFIPAVNRTADKLIKASTHTTTQWRKEQRAKMIRFSSKLVRRVRALRSLGSPTATGFVSAMFWTDGDREVPAGKKAPWIRPEHLSVSAIDRVVQIANAAISNVLAWAMTATEVEKRPGTTKRPDSSSFLEEIGHDIWLTCNGHGVGFYEPGRWPESLGALMSIFCKKEIGEQSFYVGDRDYIYFV